MDPDPVSSSGPPLSRDLSPYVTDERVNATTHLAAAVFALLGSVILVVESARRGSVWHVVGFSIYGACLIGLFVASTLHHGLTARPRVAPILRTLDYLAIFLLIAGTFTPVCLTIARGTLGWSLLGVVWSLAMAGMVLRGRVPLLPHWVTSTLYVCLGWMGVLLAPSVHAATGAPGLALLAAGGILYTVGVVIFSLERPNLWPGRFGFHELWHVLVMAAAACHYALMLRVLPA